MFLTDFLIFLKDFGSVTAEPASYWPNPQPKVWPTKKGFWAKAKFFIEKTMKIKGTS